MCWCAVNKLLTHSLWPGNGEGLRYSYFGAS